jgi:16S rRNA (cytosine1402-N4)-methyltransferase
MYHEPVLANISVEALEINPDGVYVDATFGGGGHAKRILNKLSDKGRLIAFDQDPDVIGNVTHDERLIFVPHNFRYIRRFLKLNGYLKVDGILADLGVSSYQFDTESRGFSFRMDGVLDMRMNPTTGKSAADILNTYTEEQLVSLLSDWGEVRNAKSLASALIEARKLNPFKDIQGFLNVVNPWVRGERPRYLAQVFQALRIEVNEEMVVLADFLKQSVDLLNDDGLLVVISYHSLEDRMAKNTLRYGNPEGTLQQDFYGNIYRPFNILTKKAITPDAEEIKNNSRARSAKLRVGRKLPVV